MPFSRSKTVGVLGLLCLGIPALGHHSVQAEFDVNKPVTVTGVVTKLEWVNPHSFLSVDATDANGKMTHWSFEMAGPGVLRRAGISRTDRGGLAVGNMVTVNAVLAKDGSDFALVKTLTLPDGRTFTIWGGDPNAK